MARRVFFMYSTTDFPRIWEAIFSAIRDTGVLSSTALDFWFGKIRIVCIGCGRDMLLDRVKLEKAIRKLIPAEEPTDTPN